MKGEGRLLLLPSYETEEDMGFCLNYNEPPPAYEFVADHPFLFMVIREEKSGWVGAV